MFARSLPVRWLCAALLLIAIGCSDDDAPPLGIIPTPSPPRTVELNWQQRLPQGNNLNRLAGFPDGSFYAVGDAGTILHFDGSTWQSIPTQVRANLLGVWADSPDDVYVSGAQGTLLRYDGDRWTAIDIPTTADVYAVHVNPPDDVFLACSDGTVWNRRSGTWTQYSVAPGKRLRGLLGYSHDEVYVCGSDASLFRFDGATWTILNPGINLVGDSEYTDIWGPGPGSLSFIAGQAIAWTDGTTWHALNEANGYFAYGIGGVSLDNQVMVAAGLSTHLIDGVAAWFPTPTTDPLYDVWGPAKDSYYAVGKFGHIAHFNGSGWQPLDQGTTNDIRGVCIDGGDAIAVGANGTILRRTGDAWLPESVSSQYDLSAVYSDGGISVAVGRYTPDGRDWREAILMNSGASWVDAGAIGEAQRLFDVWGDGMGSTYAVGWGGEILDHDGSTWSELAPCSPGAAFLASIDGSSPDNVFAVGRTNDLTGLICHYDGATWTPSQLPDVEMLSAVWVAGAADAFAVGSQGAIRRFDGSAWHSMKSPTSESLLCVRGLSSSDIYAAGRTGTLLHFDGTSWQLLRPNTSRTINDVAVDSQSVFLFAGDAGSILTLPQ